MVDPAPVRCPCGSGLDYSHCCGELIERQRPADTAEQLMRSRFSAFSLGEAQYLLDTLHPQQRASETLEALQQSCQQTQWLNLRILDCAAGQPGDTQGTVEFIAFYAQPNSTEPGQLHERSRFCFESGCWYYVDGLMLPDLKLGRNEACWCGSGKKRKKCHAE